MDNECPSISISEANNAKTEPSPKRLTNDNELAEADSTFDFSTSNITVIEKPIEVSSLNSSTCTKSVSCEGSDSGVEVIDSCYLQRTSSINSNHSQDFGSVTPACSYESSIISCCSNYEEAYNILVRRNSALFEYYDLGVCDGTSEGGSESSSVAGSSSSKTSKRVNLAGTKRRLVGNEEKSKSSSTVQRSRPTSVSRNTGVRSRAKSTDKQSANLKHDSTKTPNSNNKAVPNNLTLSITKKEGKSKPSTSRASSTTRTPITTPTDDGRWPSINSKPAVSMGKAVRGLFTGEASKRNNTTNNKSSTLEKYATLPRRRKENVENLKENKSTTIKENNLNRNNVIKKQTSRESSTPKSLPPYPRKKNVPKTKIYHEISIQTALTQTDIEKALSGITFQPTSPQDVEKVVKEIQVDIKLKETEQLKEKIKTLSEHNEKLKEEFKIQSKNCCDLDERLKYEKLDNERLKEELKQNTERVLAILGNDGNLLEEENSSSDSLLVLENRFQKVGQIVIQQENQISELNSYCRTLQKDLDKSLATQKILLHQHQDLECESMELQEFMQAEKSTLADALKETENEIKRLNALLLQRDREMDNKTDESHRLVRINEQRRQENMGLQARLGAFEAKSRELLIYQGSHISGAAVALSSLIARIDGLVDELVSCYSISEQELEDVIFHNEAYTNSSSSPDVTPEKFNRTFVERSSSPKRGSSFVAAIINAIKNATAQTPFSGLKEISKDTISMDNSDSTELLDSETEPCLMMEPVLEDVVVPDGHSHNMISSGHGMLNSARLSHSESLNSLPQAIYCRQISHQSSSSLTENVNSLYNDDVSSSLTDVYSLVPLVDQVIDVDNLVTKLLKVLRIIQIKSDDSMNDLENERDCLNEQVSKQKDANKVVAQQLQDWKILGTHLKGEITELMQQLNRKNNEIDDLKSELNHNRKEIERLNEDVCALSTACSQTEQELKNKQQETTEAIKKWEDTEEIPTKEILASILANQRDIPILKEKLRDKEKQLTELKQEYIDSRQVLSENWKEAVNEGKKQYEAIDNALETLHSIPTVVQQCPPLAQVQRDLEETSFQSASSLPIRTPSDCNANGNLLKPVSSLVISSPINSTA